MAPSLPSTPVDPAILTPRMAAILNRHPAVGLAAGVVHNGSLESFDAHGFADLEARTPVDEDTVFRIGSITKTFTGIAVMQLWERGSIDLDRPANDYLKAYQLVPRKASFRPTTVRQLLTHTGGVPEQAHPWRMFSTDYGQTFAQGRRVPTLAEYYDGALRVAVEPGTTFMYGDHGFATLGQIVEDVSGMRLDRYLREHVFEPLGMVDSDLLRSARVRSRLATGYRFRSRGPAPVVDREPVTAGASSIYSTPRDMARYVAALLGGGRNDHGAVLKPETVAMMFAPQYQPHPSIPGMGLGFFRADLGGHPAVEHQGIVPGFNSQIWLAPEDGVGIVAFTNGSPGAVFWMVAEFARLLRELIGVPDDPIRHDLPQHPEVWGDICGWYAPLAPATDPRSRTFFGAGAEVLVRGGRLRLRLLTPVPVLYRGFELHADGEDDPYVFGVDLSAWGVGKVRVAFNRDPEERTIGCALDLMPITLRKRPEGRNPRRWATAGLGAVGAGLALAGLRTALGRRRRDG
ncbi:MAG TPA: serine hydrolase domain-containing protein [Candidatus Dormibacteraeota bacterium]|jgi:CubicO group peptidase (beta-lactamase class C family)|nr:serine hydrolase domain-containing protein [Candidatus Dormibacteraeota bacterium]